jgi:hypothetical protein
MFPFVHTNFGKILHSELLYKRFGKLIKFHTKQYTIPMDMETLLCFDTLDQ